LWARLVGATCLEQSQLLRSAQAPAIVSRAAVDLHGANVSPTAQFLLTAAMLLLAFPLLWVGVLHLVAIISGWRWLARHFGTDRPGSGQTFTWASGKVGRFSNYNACLTVHVGDAGLHLATQRLFRPGHQPLLLPWSAIREIQQPGSFFLSSTGLTVVLSDGGTCRLLLYGKALGECIKQHRPPA
jgi:hypothetical protein